MAQTIKVTMTKAKRREILRNIMKALFAPRLAAEKKRRTEWAEKLALKEDPKFFELYADTTVRPYLNYSTSRTVGIRPFKNRRGKEIKLEEGHELPTAYNLLTPSFFNDSKGCSNDIGLRAFYDDSVHSYDRPSTVCILKNSQRSVALTDEESAEYWAFRDEDNRIQKDFDTLSSTLKTALAAARYIKNFYDEYPQFSHLSGEPVEVTPDAPLPVPTAGTLLDMISGMGLNIPSPLETKEAKDGSD